MTNTSRKPLLTTRELTTIAILAAIAAVLFMVEIPVVLFYKLDLSNLDVYKRQSLDRMRTAYAAISRRSVIPPRWT